jgi:hypothetical protein
VTEIFGLLLTFQLKHWLADYPLQRKYMLGKFREDWGFFLPLLAHVAVHGAFTFAIAAVSESVTLAAALAVFDMTIHFLMDRAKAGKRYLGRWTALTAATAQNATNEQWRSNNLFWWMLGIDQGVHHLTHYVIIWVLVTP